jgi:UDP-GlcNAc:undecaprenyl-phosphate GlcNAc-1-phosphate transferase
MTTFLVSFLLAFIVTTALTPAVLQAALRAETVDTASSHRKVHAGNIPRLGGLAIVAGFYAPLLGLAIYETRVGDAVLHDLPLSLGLLVGGLVIASLGLYDDLRQASPRLKLIVQLAVALALCALDFRVERVDLPFLPMVDVGWLSWPLTILWVVGVTNAVNLIDGLDGLAAGMALFGLAPMMVLAVSKDNLVLALVCCCLAGSLLGFLLFNFHPARIFMGDSGSMFLGYVLAVVSLATASKGRMAVAMLTPILALGLPILDTLLALARRAWFGQSLFIGDRQHIHHRLLDMGFSHRNTVLVMYGVAATWAVLGLAVHFNRDFESALLFLLSMVVAAVLLRVVGVLVLPEAGGTTAARIRARNRRVRSILPGLEASLRARLEVQQLDALAESVHELAASSGAIRAEVTLAPTGPGAPARVWRWQPDDAVEGPAFDRTLSLRPTHGPAIGQVQVSWPADEYHEAALPGLEAAFIRLVDHVMAHHSNEPTPPQERAP